MALLIHLFNVFIRTLNEGMNECMNEFIYLFVYLFIYLFIYYLLYSLYSIKWPIASFIDRLNNI